MRTNLSWAMPAALLLCAASCRKEPGGPTAGEILSTAASQARYSDACKKMVPMDYARSYPLPSASEGKQEFRMLFYALKKPGSPKGSVEALPPDIAARFTLASFDAACEKLGKPAGAQPGATLGLRFGPEVGRMGMSRFDREQAELFSATQGVSASYFGKESGEAARAAADDFYARFMLMSEPGLRPHYRELCPDFWQWLEKLTGKKI